MHDNDLQRIPSLKPAEWTDEVRDVFSILEGEEGRRNGSKFNFSHWFANHPMLAAAYLRYSYALTRGVLDPKLREIVVLRVAHRYGSAYEWVQHVKIGAHVGVGPAEVEAVRTGSGAALWTKLERNCLRAADQLCEAHDIEDALWADLSADLETKEIMELLFVIGTYTTLAWILKAVRMPLEIEDRCLTR